MTLYSRTQLYGLLYEDTILPGAMGLGDKGWPTHVAFQIGVTQSKVSIAYGANGSMSPEIAIQPFLGKAASIGWQFREVLLGAVADPQTTYSFSFEMYIPFGQYIGPNAGYPKQFVQVMDGLTKRWGLRISKYDNSANPFQYFESLSNVIALVNGNGTVLAGNTFALGSAQQYKFDCGVTAGVVTVRIYRLVSGAYTLVHTLTGSPTSTAAREWQTGNFEGDPAIATDQYNVFLPNGWPGTFQCRIKNIATWSTSNGDGSFGGTTGFLMNAPRGVEWFVWDEETQTEKPLLYPPRYHKNGAEINIDRMWNDPTRFRGRIETKNNSAIYSPDGISYGANAKQKYAIYYPNDRPMPEGGWPVVGFVAVGYYSVGSWSDMYTEGYIMMRHLLNLGVAVMSIGVRVGELVQSWLFGDFQPAQFPTAIIDAKAAIRHMVDHASSNGINVNKIYTGGHSSGGSIGGCIMITRGMTNNSHGTNLTLAANGYPGVSDPAVAGAILMDAPINFRKSWDEDPCVPKASLPWQLYQIPGGNARAAISMYNGGAPTDQTIDTTQIEIYDWVQVAQYLRPVLFVASSGDTVVPAHNGTHLRNAYLARGRDDCTYFDMGGVKHDFMTNMPPIETIRAWLQEQGAI